MEDPPFFPPPPPQEFKPEILTMRSRAEMATVKRRMEMAKEIERHERERIQTARPEDLEQVPSPASTELEGYLVRQLAAANDRSSQKTCIFICNGISDKGHCSRPIFLYIFDL